MGSPAGKIEIVRLPCEGFDAHALDDFVRHQAVTECRRYADGERKLLPIAFTEDRSLEKRRDEALGIIRRLNHDLIAFAAY